MRNSGKLWRLATVATGLLLVGAACQSATQSEPPSVPGQLTTAVTPQPSLEEPGSAGGETILPTPEDSAEIAAELRSAGISTSGWKTDFTRRSVPYSEIMSGGPSKDGIPAIDHPKFVSVEEAAAWLDDREPVQVVDISGKARAYPIQILIWHEIVNDVVGGTPVTVTFCPLCNTALVFQATLPDGRQLDFGTTGKLRFSDLVMYDRQTESWWQQLTGEAIIGELTGTRLEFIPSPVVSWSEFKQAHPEGRVLSRDTGFSRSYGRNPYSGYDSGQPFLYRGPEDDRLRATERVATVTIGATDVAFPFSVLQTNPVVHYVVDDSEIVIFYKQGTASALDRSDISEGRDVGATGVYIPEVNNQLLTFQADGDHFIDRETGSTWNLLGQAISGTLEGERLEPVVHGNHFWFAWAAFKPNTIIYKGNG